MILTGLLSGAAFAGDRGKLQTAGDQVAAALNADAPGVEETCKRGFQITYEYVGRNEFIISVTKYGRDLEKEAEEALLQYSESVVRASAAAHEMRQIKVKKVVNSAPLDMTLSHEAFCRKKGFAPSAR